MAAGDFLDADMPDALHKKRNGVVSKGAKYFQEYTEGMGAVQKSYRWAWHAYEEGAETAGHGMVNRPKSWWRAFKLFKEAIAKKTHSSPCVPCRTPNVWLDEQGVVFFNKGVEENVWHESKLAEEVMRAYVQHGSGQLTRQPQVTRFFYYSTRGAQAFDSGLLEAPQAELSAKEKKARPMRPAENTPREIYRIYKEKALHGG